MLAATVRRPWSMFWRHPNECPPPIPARLRRTGRSAALAQRSLGGFLVSVPRFWREIPQRYALQASKCGVCETVHYPPRRLCPDCRRESIGNITRTNLSGHGRIIECTRVHKPAPGYDTHAPYHLALIETDEGPRLVGQLVETEGRVPEAGQSVEATFRRIGSDGDAGIIHYGIKWRLASHQDDSSEE